MLDLYIANPKGGCGKTTIAAQIAAFFAAEGITSALVDHDPQKSCSDWVSVRPKKLAKITLLNAGAEPPVDTQLCVHDLPAAWAVSQAQQRFKPGDKLIIPVLPSSNDIRACIRFLMTLQRAGLVDLGVDLALVANRVRSNTNYYQTLLEFLNRLDWPLLTSIRDTQNYVYSMDAGLSIFDLPHHRVANDLAQWTPLLRWVSAALVPKPNRAAEYAAPSVNVNSEHALYAGQ